MQGNSSHAGVLPNPVCHKERDCAAQQAANARLYAYAQHNNGHATECRLTSHSRPFQVMVSMILNSVYKKHSMM